MGRKKGTKCTARVSPATQADLTQRRKGAKGEFFAGFAPLREFFFSAREGIDR